MQNNKHGHSMSLAQPPTFTPPPAFNPFGPNATLGDSPGPLNAPLENIHAPQGRVPVTASSLALPPSLSRPDSRPDFARGFGLDVPEEEEPEESEVPTSENNGTDRADDGDADIDESVNGNQMEDEIDEQDGATTVAQSRLHSRHVSNALSLGSVGGVEASLIADGPGIMRSSTPNGNAEFDELDQDAIGEWTGSEDQNLSDMSEDEVCVFKLSSKLVLTGLIRGALASGQTRQTRKELARIVLSVEIIDVLSVKLMQLVICLSSPFRPTIR